MAEKWYKNVNNNSGIWIGNGIDIQNAIKINNLSKTDASEDFKGVAYTIENNCYKLIKCNGTEDEGGDSY